MTTQTPKKTNQRFASSKKAAVALFLFTLAFIQACTKPYDPEWHKDATIYEVNVRQHTPEGTFAAFTQDIPRLKKMGVEILWLMPIHPIGELNRKGTLGSGYSIQDYSAVNPKFGTEEDFRNLVRTAHQHDMKVILDWVANHTAWDHPWTQTNPDFYNLTEDGNFQPPVADWSDVIDLNFDNPEMREAMIQEMEFWIREYDVDGFRCDVAWSIPTDFWAQAIPRLEALKPVFMLAEADMPEHHEAGFDMSYPWEFMHIQFHVADGDSAIASIDRYMQREFAKYDRDNYRMFFTSNHDENSWKGSDTELYGDNFRAFAVLSGTIHGMPLVYSGQETGLDRRLEFFEKDPITWDDYEHEAFYTTLLHLKKDNSALWNGTIGGAYEPLRIDEEAKVFGYRRANDQDEVVVYLNFSTTEQTIEHAADASYKEAFTGETYTGGISATLPAHGYAIYVKQ